MKQLILILSMLAIYVSSFAQLNTFITDATNYNNTNIITNATKQITAVKVNSAIDKVIRALKYIDTAQIFVKNIEKNAAGDSIVFFIGSKRFAIEDKLGAAGITDGNKGDITVSGTGTLWNINDGVVTQAKFEPVYEATLLKFADSSVNGGYYPYATNPKNYLTKDSVNPLLKYTGNIVNQSTWPSLAGWTANGATVSLSGGFPQISAPVNSCFNTFDYNYSTGSEYWRITSTEKVKNSAAIPSVGIRAAYSNMGVLGRILPYSGTSYAVDLVGACGPTFVRCDSFITVNVNDVLELTLERSGNNFVVIARNITTNSLPYIVNYNYNTVVDILPTTGKACAYAFEGSYELQKFRFDDFTLKNAALIAVTDSKFAPYGSSYANGAFQNLSKNNTIVLSTSPNDRTNEVIDKLPEIIALKPQQMFLAVGSNDIRNAVPVANVIAALDVIITTCRSAGIEVYIGNCTYETAVNLAPLKDAINAKYSVDSVIDTWTPSLTPGFLIADGVHLSEYGQRLMYNLLSGSFKFNKPQFRQREISYGSINNSSSPQTGSFSVTGESTVANTLNIGNSTAPFSLKATTNAGVVQFLGAGGYNNIRGVNAAGTSFAALKLLGTQVNIATAVGLSEYEGLHIERAQSRFGGGLIVGNQYDLANSEAFGINPGNGAYAALSNFSGTNYLSFMNAAGGITGTPLNMRASSYSLNSFTGGVGTLNLFAQNGKVGIATSTLDSTLNIDGGLKINNGAAQNGYVWTSTGTDGRATWMPAITAASFIYNEEFTGSTSSTYTLANAPVAGKLEVFKNGLKLANSEFSLSGAVVTLTTARLTTDVISNNYIK